MKLPRLARYRAALTYAAAILGALATLAVLVVAAVWLYDHRNAPVLVPGAIAVLALDVGMHWANLRRTHALRDLAERASDDADRALSVQLAHADTDVIPAVVADLPRRPRPYAPNEAEEWRTRFTFKEAK